MDQGGFDFAKPVADVTRVSPTGQDVPPFRGTTPASTHASWTGAQSVVETWTARQSAYLQLMRQGGPLSDQEATALLRWQLCSVNSVRGNLEKIARAKGEPPMCVPDGYDVHAWTDQSGKRHFTKRTRWRLNR